MATRIGNSPVPVAQPARARPASPAPAVAPAKKSSLVDDFLGHARELVQLHVPHLGLPHIKLPDIDELLGMYPEPADTPAAEAHVAARVAEIPLSDSAKQALSLLQAQGVSPLDIWHGSHIVIQGDGGAIYDQLSKLPDAQARGSSHYPGVPVQQYGIPLGKGELLFGKRPDGSTWVQVEAHTFHGAKPNDPISFVGAWIHNPEHMLDWTKYELTGQNVGPLGLSPHTEHHDPVIVKYGG